MATAGSSGSAVRELEIPSQIGQYEHAAAALEERIVALHERLKTVLRTPEPVPPEAASKEPPLCDLASWIRGRRINVESVTAQITDILARLEL
ncbi:MAG: hypothetical protein PHU85_13455 [Phycisphaerae bacterium]|nr:hypothetical protein [Phycisphaerae bacterium]